MESVYVQSLLLAATKQFASALMSQSEVEVRMPVSHFEITKYNIILQPLVHLTDLHTLLDLI
jgi:hypothetical protein